MTDFVDISYTQAFALAMDILRAHGLAQDHCEALAHSMCRAQQDDCQSHGLYRLMMCVNTLRAGRVIRDATPTIIDHAPAVVVADAGHGFSLLAFERALPMLVEKARTNGLAALAVRNCYHFSALWPEVEAIADQGLVAIATNPSHAWVSPLGGTAPVLGTNPLAIAWPRQDHPSLVIDFATSAMARGDLELYLRNGDLLPPGTALDAAGRPTRDPAAAMAGSMLPFGGHKGYALSLMIELLAGPLIGDLTSADSLAEDAGAKGAPLHGQLILALDPKRLGTGDPKASAMRAESLLEAIMGQGARLPADRRYAARARSKALGVMRVEKATLHQIERLHAGHP